MTAAPLSNSLAKVRKLLPVKIEPLGDGVSIRLTDKHGRLFCLVPVEGDDTLARALLIRDAMNEMQ